MLSLNKVHHSRAIREKLDGCDNTKIHIFALSKMPLHKGGGWNTLGEEIFNVYSK